MTIHGQNIRQAARFGSIALALGILAGADGAMAATRVDKTFGKWLVSCVETDGGNRQCNMSQSQVAAPNAKGAALILRITGNKDKQNLLAMVPIGVSLPDGVTLNFGADGKPMTIPYSVCEPKICVAYAAFDDKMLATFKSAPKGLANYVLPNKKLIQVNVDLGSFGDAHDYLLSQLK